MHAPPTGGPPVGDKHTMLGMPAVDLPQRAPPPAAMPPPMKTMMGVAMPGIAPTHDKPAPAPVDPHRVGTLLGVAAVAIPSPPGAPPNQPLPTAGSTPRLPTAPMIAEPSPPPPAIVPAPMPLVMEPLPEKPQVATKRGVPAIAVLAIVFALVLVVGGGAAFFVLRSGGPLTAQPQLDEAGKETLKIRCDSCPDETTISLGASSTKVTGGAAVLPLPAPLSIGDNDLEMQIDRPGSGRDEVVKVHVPVAYRVKADLSTLTASPPVITVRVEALADTEVSVDDKPVQLDASGKGSAAIDVSAEVEGPSDDQKSIDKKIPFSIKSKGRPQPEAGQLTVRAAITPLHIDAPGRELYTDHATAAISGQTKPTGTLTVDGQTVKLDAQGRFGVRVELRAEGDKTLTIVATAPPLAPRTVRAKVVRVASLDAQAKVLDQQSPLTFDAFATSASAKTGQLVVVDGDVIEARAAQGHTVMLVEDKKACPNGADSCVVRVVHGDEVRASRGDGVRVYGHLDGTVSSGGKTIPDIEGSLVLTRTPSKAP